MAINPQVLQNAGYSLTKWLNKDPIPCMSMKLTVGILQNYHCRMNTVGHKEQLGIRWSWMAGKFWSVTKMSHNSCCKVLLCGPGVYCSSYKVMQRTAVTVKFCSMLHLVYSPEVYCSSYKVMQCTAVTAKFSSMLHLVYSPEVYCSYYRVMQCTAVTVKFCSELQLLWCSVTRRLM
jgi:hypothetical protein